MKSKDFYKLLSHNIKSQKHLPNVDLSEMQLRYVICFQTVKYNVS